MTVFSKASIRARCRNQRDNLSSFFQQQASNKICKKIIQLNPFAIAEHIAFYYPLHREIDLNQLFLYALSQNKKCYFPKITVDKRIMFLPVNTTTSFNSNRFNIFEPEVNSETAIAANQLDIIFMPLLAFDSRGNRIGMGAGYYDRTLTNVAHPLLVGVAYDFQHYPCLATEPWDVPLAGVITESIIYWKTR